MAYEQKNLRGALFKNERREREEQPHYKGTCMIDGVLYRQSAWLTKAASGLTYMSLSYTKASDLPGGRASPQIANDLELDDQDIPF
jgi:hypothetical protein